MTGHFFPFEAGLWRLFPDYCKRWRFSLICVPGRWPWMCAVPIAMTAAEGQRTGGDALAEWAEGLAVRRGGVRGRGCLRFAFYGRVSTEDWQDPESSRARRSWTIPTRWVAWMGFLQQKWSFAVCSERGMRTRGDTNFLAREGKTSFDLRAIKHGCFSRGERKVSEATAVSAVFDRLADASLLNQRHRYAAVQDIEKGLLQFRLRCCNVPMHHL